MRELTVMPRLCAVLAASGPVVLTAFGVGRSDLPWFCSSAGPYALEGTPVEALFLGVLLLPVVVAGLVAYGSRRITLAAAVVTGAVLVLGLLVSGPGQARALPWPLLICYPVAIAALLLAPRLPASGRRYGVAPWVAVFFASWGALFCRLVPEVGERSLTAFYAPSEAPNALPLWFVEADRIGLPVVLVALAAFTCAVGLSRRVGVSAAAALLLFPAFDAVTSGGDPLLVRWHLVLAALLVVWPVRLRAGFGSLRRMRTVAVTAVVVLSALWLVVSSYS
ncbi:hypothetical protein [Streptosporangium saharense]|uniref:Uncharacterized protein n=1 Tax=Streptosporangium saharense TaxID=1706840 RepID=A0A7W7QPQ9_9ACTN|nr:hypothetical protein [Streptosporangium saharense]MBB4917515.1 hypothetical protein [Streptosporangium saharense]